MIAAVATALADPVALRLPAEAGALSLGRNDASVGAPLGGVWLAAEASTAGASAGASVGVRQAFGDRVRRFQGGVSAGALLPLVEPGVALTATAWTHAGWVGPDASFVAGAAAPIALGTGGARVPLLLELQGGVRVGPVAVGARLSAGPVWTVSTAGDVSTWLEPAVWLQAAPRRPGDEPPVQRNARPNRN